MSIISDVERQVRARISELKPLVDEYNQLQEVLRTFEQTRTVGPKQSARTTVRKAGKSNRRPASSPVVAGSTTYSRGKRAAEALELVKANPGITVADIAKEMDIGPTYLYRVLPALQKDGMIKKQGTGYAPA